LARFLHDAFQHSYPLTAAKQPIEGLSVGSRGDREPWGNVPVCPGRMVRDIAERNHLARRRM